MSVMIETPAFLVVKKNLLELGSFPISRFADNRVDDLLEGFDIAMPSFEPSTELSKDQHQYRSWELDHSNDPPKALAFLHRIARVAFGTVPTLKFEYPEDHDSKVRRCVLTVARPDGASRVYATEPLYFRHADARAAVAVIALQNGVQDFIEERGGARDSIQVKTEISPKDSGVGQSSGMTHEVSQRQQSEDSDMRMSSSPSPKEPDDPPVVQIENCCLEWRGEDVKPQWFPTGEAKSHATGCALRIQLAPNEMRVFSVEPIYQNQDAARAAVAEVALQQDILDYIRHGMNQITPRPRVPSDPLRNMHIAAVLRDKSRPAMSLIEFYHSLPKPLPEPFGYKLPAELNALAWLNQEVQNAICHITVNFDWIVENKSVFHGCVLRVGAPGHHSASYLVDPIFAKRQDAKAAAIYSGLAHGLKDHIHDICNGVDEVLTPQMKSLAQERVLPRLYMEYHQALGVLATSPGFTFHQGEPKNNVKQGTPEASVEAFVRPPGFGATLTIDLLKGPDYIRTYQVASEYKSKGDAKSAVVIQAARSGVFDFLRYKGEDPPAGVDLLSELGLGFVKGEPAPAPVKVEKKPTPIIFNEPENKKSKSKKKKKKGNAPEAETKPPVHGKQKVPPTGPKGNQHNTRSLTRSLPSAGPPMRIPTGPRALQSTAASGSRAMSGTGPLRSGNGSMSHMPVLSRPESAHVPYNPANFAPPPPMQHFAPAGPSHNFNPNMREPPGRIPQRPNESMWNRPYPGAPLHLPPMHYTVPPQYKAPYYDYDHPSHHASYDPMRRPLPLSPPEGHYRMYDDNHDWRGPESRDRTDQLPYNDELPFREGHSGSGARYERHSELNGSGADYRRYSSDSSRRSSSYEDDRRRSKRSREDSSPERSRSPRRERSSASEKSKGKSKATNAMAVDDEPAKLSISRFDVGPSLVVQLEEFCRTKQLPPPIFDSRAEVNAQGVQEYVVWVIQGREKMELQLKYSSISAGKEKVAKSVLARLQRLHSETLVSL
ncbi:hypothetical protein SISSUDRAFT_1050682 [Sistotremastrum suecicum HHB10207 ss-3]|uniref:Uncharacterized protein n=1 Tax=Sistotremastrum suecicum HHB10207 ss-3 TaxID=1314776 RepID=A0A166B0X3_9AGAM|nr:hypothetical protein SISSUDRAFT_1050682 [Sistotremastrum suecicum HHB10207 ss-3]